MIENICTQLPLTKEELLSPTISLGKEKVEKYYKEILSIVNKHVRKSNLTKIKIESGNFNSGAPWTHEEEKQLIEEYVNNKMSINKIALLHMRTAGAITSRLKRLGIIDK